MGKFSPTRYSPEDDSSPGTAAWRKSNRFDPPGLVGVILDYRPKPPVEHLKVCACGCGAPVENRKTKFKMGHDQRLKGILIRAHLTRTPVTVMFGSQESWKIHTYTALEHASQFSTSKIDWEVMIEQAESKQGPRVTAALERANREVLGRALEGTRRVITIGRWDFTGQVIAVYDEDSEVEIEYVTKKGDVKTRRMPAAQWAEQEAVDA